MWSSIDHRFDVFNLQNSRFVNYGGFSGNSTINSPETWYYNDIAGNNSDKKTRGPMLNKQTTEHNFHECLLERFLYRPGSGFGRDWVFLWSRKPASTGYGHVGTKESGTMGTTAENDKALFALMERKMERIWWSGNDRNDKNGNERHHLDHKDEFFGW